MKALIQRVSRSSVAVEGQVVAKIGPGMTVFLGVGTADTEKDINYLAKKIAALRIFADQAGKMNLAVRDIGGEILLISQFTLYAECDKGNRPYFGQAAAAEQANHYYQLMASALEALAVPVKCGIFQADMLVEISNDGPVTIMLSSEREKENR